MKNNQLQKFDLLEALFYALGAIVFGWLSGVFLSAKALGLI